MKRISFVIVIVLSLSAGALCQTVDDALRYSQIFWGGTSRFMSMGGAFTALGGDASTLSQNPAGIGVFRSSEFTISPQMFHIKTNAGLFGERSTDYLYNFNLNQISLISNLMEAGDVTINIGYSFNKTNNLNQLMLIQSGNATSSMADYWADSNEDIRYQDLVDAAGIAYDAWIIDTITGSNGRSYGTVFSNYGDNPPSVYGQRMRRLVTNEGYTGEHALSFGGNYNDKIFFGATIGINKINYTSHYEHLESTDEDLPSEFENFTYTDHFRNTGTGISVKIGAIIKPVDALRIGFAFHTPTWYKITENYEENISSNFSNGGNFNFQVDPLWYEYALATPFRVLAGAGLQIGKMGLVSADWEYVDYSTAKFSETGDGFDYSDKNFEIRNSLQAAHNIRLGGELRLNKLYLRGGYGYYGRAFREAEDNSGLQYNTFSAGIGFREQRISLDFGFTNYNYDQVYYLYPLAETYEQARASLGTNKNIFTMTLGYKFGY